MKVGDSEIPIVARGEIAKALADMPAKTELTVTGELLAHDWKVNGGKREVKQLEVDIQEIIAWEKPPMHWQR